MSFIDLILEVQISREKTLNNMEHKPRSAAIKENMFNHIIFLNSDESSNIDSYIFIRSIYRTIWNTERYFL